MRHGPRQFSWFIYRVTNPTMRDLFMGPSDVLKMRSGLLSVLAGDIFGRTPLAGPLAAFRAVYYAFSLLHLRPSFAAWRQRAVNIRDDSGARQGTGD